MNKLIRLTSDYFCIGVFLLPNNTIYFPDMEPEATLTIKSFIHGLSFQHLLKIAERMKWQLEVCDYWGG